MQQLCRSIEEVLDYAIAEEQKALATYRSFAKQSASAEMKQLFSGFAVEEARHATRLLAMKQEKPKPLTAAQMALLPRMRLPRTADGSEITAEAAYQLAIRAEKNAIDLYTMLGQMSHDAQIQEAFQTLAAEEKGHKGKLEADLKKHRASAGFLTKLFRLVTKG